MQVFAVLQDCMLIVSAMSVTLERAGAASFACWPKFDLRIRLAATGLIVLLRFEHLPTHASSSA